MNYPDHRIFGFTELGQLRANLHNGPDSFAPGALYSWLTSPTVDQLASKLADQWEQPLSEDEFDVLEQLEASMAELELDCDDCGGSGVDPGGLNAYEPEECRMCHGAKRMTLADVYASMATSQVTAPRKPAASAKPANTPGVAA
jgi:hypothetical protein